MKRKRKRKIKKTLLLILSISVLCVVGYFISRQPGEVIDISNSEDEARLEASAGDPRSLISGLPCSGSDRRPFAVIMGSDAVARPLSGLAEADLVFNMPVITNDMTRLMAVYVCNSPKEIGSVRSARHDFITLAMGLDAIFVHWGGSSFALDKLNKGIMDNIDALRNPYEAFFRKSGIAAPHNGFTSYSRLLTAAQKLGYRLEHDFSGYLHLPDSSAPVPAASRTLTIGFPGSFEVKYVYDSDSNSYLRWRGGAKEIDKNNGQQVAAKNVAVMIAASRQIEGQYNDVDVEGSGRAQVYRNGEEIIGTWKKDAGNQASKLFFYDSAGQEIKFMPGSIWVEIAQPDQAIIYE